MPTIYLSKLLLSLITGLLLVPFPTMRDDRGAGFTGTIGPIPEEVRRKMLDRSWNARCPMPPDDLSYIRLSYWGYDDRPHEGVIVIHRALAEEVVEIFRELFEIRFPIERVQPYEDFEISAYARNNDTVGFYCRPAQDKPSEYSIHSHGFAIDINPLINPYQDPKQGWWPEGSEKYSSRETPAKGKILLHSKVFEIFSRRGWLWGGIWEHPDYMHFEKGIIGSRDIPMSNWYFATGLTYGAP